MDPFYQDYLERLVTLHQGVLDAIEGLPPDSLDWTPIDHPVAEMNSINVLVTHLTGAERYWIGDVALGEPSGRVREAEFQVSGLTQGELRGKFNAASVYARESIAKLNLEDLASPRTSPRDGRTFTVGWALLHVLEHTAIHLGHIQITRQLWEAKY
jgi:uncharacterized damage-inducible protein DinB